jgi:hypothetical protein
MAPDSSARTGVATVEDQVKVAFGKRFRRQLAVAVIVLPALMLVVLAADGRLEAIGGIPPSMLGLPITVLIVVALAFSLWNWRCPGCRSYLGKTWYPRYCPKCGVRLHD